jgi:hypothetical protein
MADTPRLARALARIDEVNAGDPRSEAADGESVPQELLYARRMSETLGRFAPDASEALRLAARAQHVARWRIPRSEFPEGRQGYRAWRERLLDLHAELAAEILRSVGYEEAMVARVMSLVRKESLKRDAEAQALEDVACLVFLEHYFQDFAGKHDDEKLVGILRKTLAKMSPKGREAALRIDLGERGGDLVARAMAK